MNFLTTNEIDKAYDRIKHIILKTPLVSSESINEITKANIYFKLENLQLTGSFKIRGASNKILQLSREQKQNGVIAYSSGNHGQAVSYIANMLNISSTIVMPKNAPKIKIENTKKYGAKVILYNPEENKTREEIGNDIATKENKTIIKPYDDLEIIAGQGSVGKEISEEIGNKKFIPDIYLCCCGGGGLISGSSIYLKNKFPNIQIFSVEPENFNDTQLSIERNKIVSNSKSFFSICDALLANQPGEITFPINKSLLNGGISVSDQEVKNTIIKLAEHLKIIAEPGGAVAAAALLNSKLEIAGKNIVVMISGGNIDHNLLTSLTI